MNTYPVITNDEKVEFILNTIRSRLQGTLKDRQILLTQVIFNLNKELKDLTYQP